MSVEPKPVVAPEEHTLIPLEDAAVLFPPVRGSKHPHLGTLKMWANRGAEGGTKLHTKRFGGRLMTTAAWVTEFLSSIADA